MKIGITGADGFLGFHFRAYLYALKLHEICLANRETFACQEKLCEFVSKVDVVIHLAGVNRGIEQEVLNANVAIAKQLVAALKSADVKPLLLYANSTHAEKETAYGQGKRQSGEVFSCWANSCGARFVNVVLPHVFGEFGKPFYNSVISTFCYQIANKQEPQIHSDGALELIHAQDVVRHCLELVGLCHSSLRRHDNPKNCNTIRLPGVSISVSEVLSLLQEMNSSYYEHVIPDLSIRLHCQLFNTLRSYLYPHQTYPNFLPLRTDDRGALFEAVKTKQGGQAFISISKPGVIRGNHFHLRKIERFLVIQGEAKIKIRKLFSNEVKTFDVSGTKPSYVDIPTFHAHNIINLGVSELITLFWSNEIFDVNDSDTFSELVVS